MPVIYDEVFCGLWRFGVESARELLGEDPDISCYAKLLTGGLVPMAATVATERVFEAYSGQKVGSAGVRFWVQGEVRVLICLGLDICIWSRIIVPLTASHVVHGSDIRHHQRVCIVTITVFLYVVAMPAAAMCVTRLFCVHRHLLQPLRFRPIVCAGRNNLLPRHLASRQPSPRGLTVSARCLSEAHSRGASRYHCSV